VAIADSPKGKRTFHHARLRAIEPQPGEDFVASSTCWVTDPNTTPNRIEYLRYAPDSPISEEVMNSPHIAYEADGLNAHIAGKDIVLLFEVGEPAFAKVAFVREDGVYVEYMEFKPGRTWFKE